jgi:hypothetical protein
LRYAEVTGVVTLDGKPLRGAVVTYHPVVDGPEGLPYSQGTTDETGRYALQTPEGKPGAVVGKCRAIVNWPMPERRDDKGPPPPPGPLIPIQYTVVMETPLIVEVKEGGPQTIDLPLKR